MIRPRPRFKLVPEDRDAYHKVRMDQQALDDWEEDERVRNYQDDMNWGEYLEQKKKEKEEQQRWRDRKWNILGLVVSLALFFGILFLALTRPPCPIP